MTPFEIAEPKSLRSAVKLLDPDDPAVRPLGGGTALMLMMKSGLFAPSRLVSLRKIEKKYRAIGAAPDGSLRIGALAPLRAVERSAVVAKRVPLIPLVMRTLSNVRVRNVATIGGCLAHADPHMDLPPVMIALGANVTVVGPEGAREIAVADLYAGYYETTLAPAELISLLTVPSQAGVRAAYVKITTRSADDWPAVGVAVALRGAGDQGADARVVVSAATETPRRLSGAESALTGTLDEAALRRAGDAAADEAELISDPQGSAAYKRELLRVAVGRAVRRALDGGRG